MTSNKLPVLHILVIGFHHKKGCQVEFSYPPLVPPAVTPNTTETPNNSSSECNNLVDSENITKVLAGGVSAVDCPSGWKYLPTLGLPDGSHNFTEDSVFFNLPSLLDPNESVYGVSCYRQIPVEKLKIRTADVTRSTVQKSVCILLSIPVYGYIEVKLSLIAHAYFDQGDFSCTEILTKAYNQLNACLSDGFLGVPSIQHIFVGLPLREIVLRWRQKLLILFKLLLLQKRVIYYGSPVRPICCLILSIASLHPQLLEKGFQEVACVRTSRPMSPMPNFNNENPADQCVETEVVNSDGIITATDRSPPLKVTPNENLDQSNNDFRDISLVKTNSSINIGGIVDDINVTSELSILGPTAISNNKKSDLKNSLPRDISVDLITDRLAPLCTVDPNKLWAAPFPIFRQGNLCLPYLSLPYMDLLTDPSVHGYTIGTSNILFQQKKQLADVFIDVDAGTIEVSNPEIRRLLTLTTEDLRFVDFINKHVQAPKEDAEGSEQWIRNQFQGYMLAMLKTSLVTQIPQTENNTGGGNGGTVYNRDSDHFNGAFMQAWRKTNSYEQWLDFYNYRAIELPTLIDGSDGGGGGGDFCEDESVDYIANRFKTLDDVPCGHPFAGTLSVADMKLKLAHNMNNTESGRKISQAVNTTSKAVGGAISQVKGTISSWLSSMTAPTVSVGNNPQSQSQISSVIVSSGSEVQNSTNPTKNDNQNNVNELIIIDNNLITKKQDLLFEQNDNRLHQNMENNINEINCSSVGGGDPLGVGIVEIGREAVQILSTQISVGSKHDIENQIKN